MNAHDFLKDAGFPLEWKEHHLQDYLADWYRNQGYDVRTEVSCIGGRADIIADKNGQGLIIEVKKWLGRNEILQAYGQAKLYQEHLTLDGRPLYEGGKARKIVVAGLLTKRSPLEIDAAWSQADRVMHSGGCVVFVDQCPDYYPRPFKHYPSGSPHSQTPAETLRERDGNRQDGRWTHREEEPTYTTSRPGFRLSDYVNWGQESRKVAQGVWSGFKVLWWLCRFIGRWFTSKKYSRNYYNHKARKRPNFLLIYLAIAVLAVCFDMGQRLVTHFTQNQPQPQTVIYK